MLTEVHVHAFLERRNFYEFIFGEQIFVCSVRSVQFSLFVNIVMRFLLNCVDYLQRILIFKFPVHMIYLTKEIEK